MSGFEIESLGRLEELVVEAASRLRDLVAEREELQVRNQALRERSEELERLQAQAGDWMAERRELIERVEKLVRGLDELIAATGK